MKKKHKDLKPWLDYFDMLQQYERKGYLQMEPEKHEAYVTQTAIHAMSPGDDPQQQLMDGSIEQTVRCLKSYAAFLSTKGSEYMKQPFAIHVVRDEPPHDLLHTLLITPRRSWRTMWRRKDRIEVISYSSEKN